MMQVTRAFYLHDETRDVKYNASNANRNRGNELSCAVVVSTLTAAETQLTERLSLSLQRRRRGTVT